MSGPKVIRVVTREELIARSRSQLARLDSVVAEWRKIAAKADGISVDALSDLDRRRKDLEQRLERNQFAELERAIEIEVSFLKSDMDKRLQQAIEAAVKAKFRRRQEMETARALLKELSKVETNACDRVAKQLTALADGEDIPAAGVLEQAFEILTKARAPISNPDQHSELAKALADGERRTTYSDWLAKVESSPPDELSQRIERHLAELRERNEAADATRFEEAAERVRNETNAARRNMLSDTLLIELSASVERSRRNSEQLTLLKELAAKLRTVGTPTAEAVRQDLENAIRLGTTDAETLFAQARTVVDNELATYAAQQRRRVLLKGLAELGYEVTEGMQTAWVRDGQIVTRKAANPHVGMEIGGGADAAKLQVRAVAFGQHRRDAVQDRDVEAAWCSDIDRLQDFMRQHGGQIAIEKSKPIGAVPLKEIVKVEDERGAGLTSPPIRSAKLF